MDEIATLDASLAEAKQQAEEAGGEDETLNQAVKDAEQALSEAKSSLEDDPVKKEVKKLEKKQFTRRERLNFEKRKIDEQLQELNKEEGVESPKDDDVPVTMGMLKKMEQEKSKKTALELAEEIEDEDERTLTQHYIKERITPSGNPQEDLNIARAIVNSLKNSQIAEELERKKSPKGKGTPPGSPKSHEKEFRPTAEERLFMSPPYNLTKEDVIKARQQKEANNQSGEEL